MPRINNTIHRKVFVCRGQKSTSNQCMTHYHTVPNALNCHVLPHIAHTVHNAITTFYINIHFNRSQNVVHALRKDAICCVLLRYALLCIFGGQFPVADEKYLNHMNFPSCNALKCRNLRCFAAHPLKSVMYRILPKSGLEGKMRQISASKRSQNVVEIAKTDYCGFGQVLPVILPYPSISRYRKILLTITISRALVLSLPY